MAKTQFGDTVPYYKISQAFAVDYSDVLVVADRYTNDRLLPEFGAAHNRLFSKYGCLEAVFDQVTRFTEVRKGAPY